MHPPAPSEQDSVPFPQGNSWLRWLPFIVLCLGAVIGLLLWQHFPERWPVHWGWHGKPDRWANKTLPDVFSPLGFGVVLCGLLEGIAVFLLAYARAGKNRRVVPQAAYAIAGLTAECIRIVSLALSVVFASLALVLPFWQPVQPGRMVLGVLILLGMAIAFGMWRMRQGARALQARGLWAGLEGWNGLIYRNPRDPRLWVPKITGPGYTLNFAHRRAWLLLLAFLAGPLLVVLILQALS